MHPLGHRWTEPINWEWSIHEVSCSQDFESLVTPVGLLVLVVVLGFSFLSIVLVPGLELASEVADSSTALKLLGEQQRHPTLIRASLDSMHERLGERGYIQESLGSAARLEQRSSMLACGK